jgi:hypothetical protein
MAHNFKRGERVEWNFRGARAVGKVKRRLVERTEVGGRPVAATPEDPRYLVVTDRGGVEVAKRPEALRRVAEG